MGCPAAPAVQRKADGMNLIVHADERLSTDMLAHVRTYIRYQEYKSYLPDWNRGGCGVVSEDIERVMGWQRSGGCYITAIGRHIAHYWNLLDERTIIDVTADQFGEPGNGVRITSVDDKRYDSRCDCGGRDG